MKAARLAWRHGGGGGGVLCQRRNDANVSSNISSMCYAVHISVTSRSGSVCVIIYYRKEMAKEEEKAWHGALAAVISYVRAHGMAWRILWHHMAA